jgi:hypothetical protein
MTSAATPIVNVNTLGEALDGLRLPVFTTRQCMNIRKGLLLALDDYGVTVRIEEASSSPSPPLRMAPRPLIHATGIKNSRQRAYQASIHPGVARVGISPGDWRMLWRCAVNDGYILDAHAADDCAYLPIRTAQGVEHIPIVIDVTDYSMPENKRMLKRDMVGIALSLLGRNGVIPACIRTAETQLYGDLYIHGWDLAESWGMDGHTDAAAAFWTALRRARLSTDGAGATRLCPGWQQAADISGRPDTKANMQAHNLAIAGQAYAKTLRTDPFHRAILSGPGL